MKSAATSPHPLKRTASSERVDYFNLLLPAILIFQVGVLFSDESLLNGNAQSMQPRQKESEQSKEQQSEGDLECKLKLQRICLFFKRLTYQIESAGTRILIVEREAVLGITLPTLVQLLPRYRSGQHQQQQLQLLLTIATPVFLARQGPRRVSGGMRTIVRWMVN